jgi:hypothetical protein
MLLADGGVTFIWIGWGLLAGLAGVFVIVLRALFRGLGFVLRALLGRERSQPPPEPPHAAARERLCRHPRCGYVNRGAARYCARCGTLLEPVANVDRHG